MPKLIPLLVVAPLRSGGAAAVDFYKQVLPVTVSRRFEHGRRRHLSHADLALDQGGFAVADSLGGDQPPYVVLQLQVDDVAEQVGRMVDRGAVLTDPVQHFLDEPMARVRDPFGHTWLIRQGSKLSEEEERSRRDALFAALEDVTTLSSNKGAAQARAHLLLGPVGAGKSTLAFKLRRSHDAVVLDLDDWMGPLFRPDRPSEGVTSWYQERARRCVDALARFAEREVAAGRNVVLELGLVTVAERRRFLEQWPHPLTVHVLDAPRDVRRQRVDERNRDRGPTHSMEVPPEIFELASDAWEPIRDELDGQEVRLHEADN